MIVSGSAHLIIPKKVLIMTVLAASSVIGGVVVSNHLYARELEAFLAAKTKTVKKQNKQLELEQEEYLNLFNKLTDQLDQEGHKSSDRGLTRESVVSFRQLAMVRCLAN